MKRIYFLPIVAILTILSSLAFADIKTKSSQSNPSILKQAGTVRVQFDVKRVVLPVVLQYASKPQTWRAYLPMCPPGSNYVSGVNPTMVQLDYPPNYPYCNCICNGNCSGVKGITASAGQAQQPIYTATVTCSATVQGWFDSMTFTQSGSGIPPNVTPIPHQYTYCQAGSCTTNPLPSNINYSVPVGGYANTFKVDFLACPQAVEKGCGTPDPISLSRQ